MVKVYLSRKDIPFEEVNVSGNREGVMRLIALGRNTTPVTTIGDEVIVGYKPKDIDAALETAGISETQSPQISGITKTKGLANRRGLVASVRLAVNFLLSQRERPETSPEHQGAREIQPASSNYQAADQHQQ
jgi:glutaredoxin